MKPMTATEILEWADLGWSPDTKDRAVAEHLAYCMRVTALVEADAKGTNDRFSHQMLAEAVKELK